MELSEYQKKARETAIYPSGAAEIYPLLGLVGEVGEFSNKYKKIIRDGTPFPNNDALSELGDIMWYLCNLAFDMGFDFEEVAEYNIKKLTDRMDRGVIGGSGDNR